MKPIKITRENSAALEAALTAVNGTATKHTFGGWHQLSAAVDSAETEALGLLGAKNYLPGMEVHATSGGQTTAAYKYSRIVTHVVLQRRASGWFLVSAHTGSLGPSQSGSARLSLTVEQAGLAMTRFAARFDTQPA